MKLLSSLLPRVLRFGTRGVALREPAFPAFDRLGAAVATAVCRTDERAVGEPHPSDAAARPPVFQRTVLDHDRATGFERESRDTTLEQLCRRRCLEAPKRFAAVLVLDVHVEP